MVQAILNNPTLLGKHARWRSRVYGSGVSESAIIYHSWKANANANALSRNSCMPAPQEGIGESEVQVAAVSSEPDISFSTLLQAGPMGGTSAPFSKEQEKDA